MTLRRAIVVGVTACGVVGLTAAFGLARLRAQTEETPGEPLADIMSRQLTHVHALLTSLALSDRAKVEENGNKLGNEALNVAAATPPKRAEETATFRYLAYKLHVNAREAASAPSPKLAQEKLGEVLGCCVDCHHLFRD